MSDLRSLSFVNENLLSKIDVFIDELLSWNKIHNLSGKTSKEEVSELVYDSIYPIEFLGDLKTVLDIGTGAGFPGFVLAIAKPETKFVLVEPSTKRTSFLNYMKSTLGLKNVEIKRARIEEVEPFKADLITSKAVSDAKTLYLLSKEFMGEDTQLLLYKGVNTQSEAGDFTNVKIIKNLQTSYMLIKKD